MQTLKFGTSTYFLSPARNVGELRAKFAKCTGKAKRPTIAKERRRYPAFRAGMSTAQYVHLFYSMNSLAGEAELFEPLNCEPCTLYSGEDLYETIDESAPAIEPAEDATQESAPAEQSAPEPQAEPAEEQAPKLEKAKPYPGYDDTRAAVYRAHLVTAARAHRLEGLPAFGEPGHDSAAWDDRIAINRLRARSASRTAIAQALRNRVAASMRADRIAARGTQPPTLGAPAASIGRPPELYQYLPLFAKIAIERLDSDSSLRDAAMLDALLDSYAATYGETCDAFTRASSHYRAWRRFWNFAVNWASMPEGMDYPAPDARQTAAPEQIIVRAAAAPPHQSREPAPMSRRNVGRDIQPPATHS